MPCMKVKCLRLSVEVWLKALCSFSLKLYEIISIGCGSKYDNLVVYFSDWKVEVRVLTSLKQLY